MIIMIMYGNISYKHAPTGHKTSIFTSKGYQLSAFMQFARKKCIDFVMFQGYFSDIINKTDMHAEYGILDTKLAQCNFSV